MKAVVLEHPRIGSKRRFNDIANTPLWSCLMGGYAAAALESDGFETNFIDNAVPGCTFEVSLAKVMTLNPELLSVNAVYFWEHTPALFSFFEALRKEGFNGHINLFGFFPTLIYRSILANTGDIDSIAVGEFERTLPELATALKSGQTLEEVEGLALHSCLEDGRNRMRRPEKNPDLFAFPKRSSLEGTVSVLASRGCYNHCSFCPVPSYYNGGKLWRSRSPENVAEEMSALVEQGVSSFYFCDANFIGPGIRGKERVLKLMELITPLNISFGMETRPQDLDDEIMEALVTAGFESLLMGVESGSKNVLQQMGKLSGPDLAAGAIELCRKHKIEPEIGFLMFIPDSSLKDLQENLDFLLENNLLDRLARTANLLSHTQIVFAGTSGYSHFEEEGLLDKHGLFNFEADVKFSDPGVEWVATLLTYGCHWVLRSMGEKNSPIYWELGETEVGKSINDYLVRLASSLIEQGAVAGDYGQEALEREKEKIEQELITLLQEETAPRVP